ncbi:Palmitoyl-protein thioesterase 1 [Gurleya vavrai]
MDFYFNSMDYLSCINNCIEFLRLSDFIKTQNLLFYSYLKTGYYQKGIEVFERYQLNESDIIDSIKITNDESLKNLFHIENIENEQIRKNIIDDAFFLKILNSFLLEKNVELEDLYTILIEGYKVLVNLDNICLIDTKKDIYVFGNTNARFLDTFGCIIKIDGNDFDFKNKFKLDLDKLYIFNGNIIGIGPNPIQNYIFLLLLKILYPQNIFLNCGNQEFYYDYSSCHLYDKIKKFFYYEDENMLLDYGYKPSDYNNKKFENKKLKTEFDANIKKLEEAFIKTFSVLPLATIINRSVYVGNSGLSKDFLSIDEILNIDRKSVEESNIEMLNILMSNQPSDKENLESDDFYDSDVTEMFLNGNKLKLIISVGHEFLHYGYKTFYDKKIITLSSAPIYTPHYDNDQFYLIFKEKGGKTELCEGLTYDKKGFSVFRKNDIQSLYRYRRPN